MKEKTINSKKELQQILEDYFKASKELSEELNSYCGRRT